MSRSVLDNYVDNVVDLDEWRTRFRNFTEEEMKAIRDVCQSFGNLYRPCWYVFGTTEYGDGWCVIYDNHDYAGDPVAQIFIDEGLIHHTGKFGTAKPHLRIENVLLETLPEAVVEEYHKVAANG